MSSSSDTLTREAFHRLMRRHGNDERDAFVALAIPGVTRVLEQLNSEGVPKSRIKQLCRKVWDAGERIGLPSAPGPQGPGMEHLDLTEELAEPILEILSQLRIETKAVKRHFQFMIVRDLLRTLVHPEVSSCTMSFKKRDKHGCERQNHDHCASRLSGSHCEECPFFVNLEPAKHWRLLKTSWHQAHGEALTKSPERFLPDDFRNLRRFLYMRSRYGKQYSRSATRGVA